MSAGHCGDVGGRGRVASRNLASVVRHVASTMSGYRSSLSLRWIVVLAFVPFLAACTPALELPGDFWKLLATADQNAQTGQAQGRTIALMRSQRLAALKPDAKPDLQKLLDWLDPNQPFPEYQERLPLPPDPPGFAKPGKTQAQYAKEYRQWQVEVAKWNLEVAWKRYEFVQKTILAFEANLSELRRLPLGVFLEDDRDFQNTAEAYERARAKWNSILDTAVTIIGTNRNLGELPDFVSRVKEANKAAEEITPPFTRATDKIQVTRRTYIAKGLEKVSVSRGKLQEFADAVNRAIEAYAAALQVYNVAAKVDVSPIMIPPVAQLPPPPVVSLQKSGDGEEQTPEFQWIGSPLFAGGISIVDLLKSFWETNKAVRAFLMNELKARKWPSMGCLVDPKQAGCSSASEVKPDEPKK